METTAKNILDFFERTAARFPRKKAFGEGSAELSFSEMKRGAERVGSALFCFKNLRRPVALYMKRSIFVPVAMLGVLYGGNFYVPLDVEAPEERTRKILAALDPVAVVADEDLLEEAGRLRGGAALLSFKKLMKTERDEAALAKMRKDILSSDPAVAIFTSGSTGFPKGSLLTHANVTAYIAWFTERFQIDEDTVFGSQCPFYFSMSVSDMYGALYTGASYRLVPRSYFTFPGALVPYLNEQKVNALYWVPSAYGILSKLDLFSYEAPKYLDKLLFAGEVMPVRYLNYLRSHLPNALYANLFGPTETTDICGYYIVDREFAETETLPLGRPCENCRLFLVGEDGREIREPGVEGELYAAGPFVAAGYYNNPEKTKEAFVRNPLQSAYPETVYRTGDVAKYAENGELLYVGRRDYQIKRMGYRIELGEIEAVMSAATGVEGAVCVYCSETDRLVLFCESGEENTAGIAEYAREKLPAYMRPDAVIALPAFPLNANGKIDRLKLKREYADKK